VKAYLDSSVLIRVLLNEPSPLKNFKRISLGVSCEIIKVECLRVIDRIRLQERLTPEDVGNLHITLQQACSTMELVRVSPLLLGMASQPYPTTVRTLDALHLSAALLWSQSKEEQIVFLTHDNQLGNGAKSLGFRVEGLR